MYFWDMRSLVADLRAGRVGDAEQFGYLFAWLVSWGVSGLLALLFTDRPTDSIIISSLIGLPIYLAAAAASFWSYRRRGGRDFLTAFLAVHWVLTIWAFAAAAVMLWLTFFGTMMLSLVKGLSASVDWSSGHIQWVSGGIVLAMDLALSFTLWHCLRACAPSSPAPVNPRVALSQAIRDLWQRRRKGAVLLMVGLISAGISAAAILAMPDLRLAMAAESAAAALIAATVKFSSLFALAYFAAMAASVTLPMSIVLLAKRLPPEGTPFDERSGEGPASAVPPEIRKWSWGAFALNWVWGLHHSVYRSLLALVPLFGIAVPFYLGFKGNELAWRSGRWASVADFQKAQRRWSRWGLTLLLAGLLFATIQVAAMVVAVRRNLPMVPGQFELPAVEHQPGDYDFPDDDPDGFQG